MSKYCLKLDKKIKKIKEIFKLLLFGTVHLEYMYTGKYMHTCVDATRYHAVLFFYRYRYRMYHVPHTHTQHASRETQDPVVHARDTHSRVHFRGRNSPHKACTIVGTFLLSMCSEFSIALVITIVLIGDSESTQTQPLKPMATSNLTCELEYLYSSYLNALA